MNVKTPLSPPRSNKILSQIQQHSQLIAQISNRKDELSAGSAHQNCGFVSKNAKISSNQNQFPVNNVLSNLPTISVNDSSATKERKPSIDLILDTTCANFRGCGDSNHRDEESVGLPKDLLNDGLTCESNKILTELANLESILLSSVKSDDLFEVPRSPTLKFTSCDSKLAISRQKNTSEWGKSVSSSYLNKRIYCGFKDQMSSQSVDSRTAAGFKEDKTDWRSKCVELEKQLYEFKEKAGKIKELMHVKFQEQEFRVQEATKKADAAETELRRLQSCTMPAGIARGSDENQTCLSKGATQHGERSTSDADKDRIINDLKLEIENYREQRRQEVMRVEGHSKTIRDWVASKFQQLEDRSSSLQSERDLLQHRLYSLQKKLYKLERTSDASSAVDDVDICFTGSQYFHNKSPDTDEEDPQPSRGERGFVDGVRQSTSCPRTMPEVKIERKIFPKELALSFMSSCDESQMTEVNTSRSSEDETPHVSVTDSAARTLRQTSKPEDNESKTDDLMKRFLAMKRDESSHTVSALATMPRCKAGEVCVPDYRGTNKSRKLKMMTMGRNFRSSSVAPRANPTPPTVPLRRVPSWEMRIQKMVVTGLTADRRVAQRRSSPSKVILFYERGACSGGSVPVFAVTRKRAVKLSDSPLSSDARQVLKSLSDVSTAPDDGRCKSPGHRKDSLPTVVLSPSKHNPTLIFQPGSVSSPQATQEDSGLAKKKTSTTTETLIDDRSVEEENREESLDSLNQNESTASTSEQKDENATGNVEDQSLDITVCLEHMTQSDTSSDYALPPDNDNDSNLGFGRRLEEKKGKDVRYAGLDARGIRDEIATGRRHDGDDDDDDDDKWGIFEKNVVKSGWLLLLESDIKGWRECWCVFNGEELKVYSAQQEKKSLPSPLRIDESTKVSHDGNTFKVDVNNEQRTFACVSSSSSRSWAHVLSKAINRCSSERVMRSSWGGGASLSSWLTKSKNGQNEKCWCVLKHNVLNFFKTPKCQLPYAKLSLTDFRVEELDSSGSSADTINSLFALWPSPTSQDLSPTYLHVPNDSSEANWLHGLLKGSSGGASNPHRHGTEFERCIIELMSFDGDPACPTWKDPALSYTRVAIVKPLVSLPSEELSMTAVKMFKYILDFVSLSIDWNDLDTKVNLVQWIFSICHHHHHLHNEIFCQLIKQTTRPQQQKKSLGNFLCGGHHWFLCDSSPTSPLNSTIETSDPKAPAGSAHPPTIQGWQLLAIALHLFLPNKQSILWMLKKHLHRNADFRSECGKYAVYCQCAMERVQLNGPRSHPPSQLEVLSVLSHNPYHHSQPISIPVHLSNSSYQVVSFDGSTLVREFLTNLNKLMSMRENHLSGFALFACDSDDPGREVCCLDLDAKICDVLSCLEVMLLKLKSKKDFSCSAIKLLYRNRLYFKSLSRRETEKERLLLACQFHNEIMQGKFPVTEELAIELVALMAQIEYGDMKLASELSSLPKTSHSPHHQCTAISQVADRFLPKFFVQSDNDDDDDTKQQKFENGLVQSWSRMKGKGSEDCVRVFLAVVRRWPFCGSKLVLAKQIESGTEASDDVWFCIHEEGISILETTSLKPLYSFKYDVIVTFGGCQEHMFVVVKRSIHSPFVHKRFLFAMSKSEGQEVVLLMADYIDNRHQHKSTVQNSSRETTRATQP